MLSLLAAAFDQGLAYAREGYRIYLIRPPYEDKREATAADVERALRSEGFKAELLPFRDWSALFTFVRKKSEEAGAHADAALWARELSATVANETEELSKTFPMASKRYGKALMPLVKTMHKRGYFMASGE